MQTEGFLIYEPGESDLGVFPQRYELTGPFYFNDEEERHAFIRGIEAAFLTFLEEGSFRVYDMEEWLDEAKYKKRAVFLSPLQKKYVRDILSDAVCEVVERGVLENGVQAIMIRFYFKDEEVEKT